MTPPARIPERSEVAPGDQWDLNPLFVSNEQWETLFSDIESRVKGYTEFRGHLSESESHLAHALAFDLDLSRSFDRLHTFAHLRSDEDQSNQIYQAMMQRTQQLQTRLAEASSFFRPEILAIPEAVIDRWLSGQTLAPYRFLLEQMLRHRAHTLSPETEAVMAMSQDMGMTPYQVFGQLDHVDLDFGRITDARGHDQPLTHGNFITFLMDPDRRTRETAFRQYYRPYHQHRHTLAAILAGSVRRDLFYARARAHPDCRAAALHPHNIPETVYDNLTTVVRDGLPKLFSYLSFRKEQLNLPALHFFDTYVPIVPDVEFDMPYEQAVDTCCEALAPLGDAYVGALRDGLLNGWVDRYENRSKRSGAYSSGCYDSFPYILMNYDSRSINSLYTLIHESGHSMHTWYSNRHQPYAYHGYTIFAAEVASTVNEVMLTDHLLASNPDNDAMQAYILNREIDNIRATLFRQTMFAEFEVVIHRMAEAHDALTLDAMTAAYKQLLQTYFGEELVIDDELPLEYLRIPHFYSAFYVYQYATGISAAIALARGIGTGESARRDAYIDFLSMGGSRFPLDALRSAGVDMASPEPVHAAIEYFGTRLDLLKKVR